MELKAALETAGCWGRGNSGGKSEAELEVSCPSVAQVKPTCKALSGSFPSGVTSLVCSKG